MPDQVKTKIWQYSFPVASLLLGLLVGTFAFFHQSPKSTKAYPVEYFLNPFFIGLTTTYIVLSVGINLRIAKERKARRKSIKF